MKPDSSFSNSAFRTVSRLIQLLNYSAGATLLGFAVAAFMGNVTSGLWVSPMDPLFMISMRTVFWIFAAFALATASVSLFGKNAELRALLPLWLALSFWVYEFGLRWRQIGLAGYLTNIADAFGVTPAAIDRLFDDGFLYVLVGSAVGWCWAWLCRGRFVRLPERADGHEFIKMTCPSCETHISFGGQYLGRDTLCPRCKAVITLQRDVNLKMSCFFCKEHVEFPAYALGRKIKCPHCSMGIGLREST